MLKHKILNCDFIFFCRNQTTPLAGRMWNLEMHEVFHVCPKSCSLHWIHFLLQWLIVESVAHQPRVEMKSLDVCTQVFLFHFQSGTVSLSYS